jgi:hypothetical protein
LDVQDAAAFLSPTGAAHNSPAPEQTKAAATKNETAFDPVAFASKLQYTEQVDQLGLTEAAAKDFSIGFYRGQVYILIRHSDGSISGFVGYAEGQLKLPPKWLPATSNVVTFSKKTA